MGSESQTLNDLYNHLQEYTPQTVSMDLPSELGTGRISQTKTKHGIILSDWQMKYHSDMNVHGVNSEEYIQIIFCLNEGISWGMTGEKDSISIGKKESCIYKGHGKTEYAWYEKNSSFSFKSVKSRSSIFRDCFQTILKNRKSKCIPGSYIPESVTGDETNAAKLDCTGEMTLQ